MKLKYAINDAEEIIESNPRLKDAIIAHCEINNLNGTIISMSNSLDIYYENTPGLQNLMSLKTFKQTYKENKHIVNSQDKQHLNGDSKIFYID